MKRLLTMLLAIAIVLSMIPMTALQSYATVIETPFEMSGTCGKNLTWTLKYGVLTISGTGAMANYSDVEVPWYDYRDSITSVVLNEGVTTVGNSAFYNCVKLTKVTLPSTLTTIDSAAFSCCEKLTSITLPEGLTTIGDYAFLYCFSLKNVTLPESLTKLGVGAFHECDALTEIRIPSKITTISEQAFYSCDNLAYVEIPYGVTAIGNEAFFNSKSLSGITIPNSVRTIGSNAFFDSPLLDNITIPASVEEIGVYAFAWCFGMTQITFEGDAPAFHEEAFSQTTTTAFYPAGNKTWTDDVKKSYDGNITWIPYGEPEKPDVNASGTCGENLTWILVDGVLTISGTGAMSWPEGDVGYGYDVPWLEYARQITTVVMEEGVTNIGPAAFAYCENLTSVTIPEGVTEIGASAFCGVVSLKELVIPSTVTLLGDYALAESCLERLVFMGGRPEKGSDVMMGTNLLCIHYPAGNETWAEKESFNGNASVAWGAIDPENGDLLYVSGKIGEVNWLLEKGVLTISGSGYLRGMQSEDSLERGYWMPYCNSVCSAVIEEGVKTVSKYQFYGCENLTSVTVSGTLETIGIKAFENCPALEEITFRGDAPNDHIHPEAFSGITVTAYYPADNETWTEEVRQQYGGKITWVAWEKEIPGGTCGDNLTWELEEGVLTISGTGAMDDFGLWQQPWVEYAEDISSVCILEGVTTVGDYAFHGCSVSYASLPDGLTTIGKNAFYGCGLKEIEIPYGVTSIGHSAFYGTDLTSVSIPGSVEAIGTYAFGCSALTDVELQPGIQTIGKFAFEACEFLTTVTIPNTVTQILDGAFGYCSSLEEITFGKTAPAIADDAFCGVTATIYYPPDYPAWDALIGKNFGGIITWSCLGAPAPKSGQCGDDLYWTLDVNSGVLTVTGTGAMWDNEDGDPWWLTNPSLVTSVVFEEGVTSVGRMAFMDHGNLTSVSFSDTLETIGGGAFNGCPIENVTIPASVTQIGSHAFWQMPRSVLKTVTVHGSPAIGANAFGGAEMNRITFTGDAPAFDENAFYGTTAYISYPADNATWNDVVGNHYGGTLIRCPDGVKPVRPTPNEVGERASGTSGECKWVLYTDGKLVISSINDLPAYLSFDAVPWYEYRTEIWEVVIGDHVTGIENGNLFYLPLMESITFSEYVNHISSNAFSGATRNLHTVNFEGDAPDISADAFAGVTADVYYDGESVFWQGIAGKNYGGNLTWRTHCIHEDTRLLGKTKPTCTETGYTGDTVCTDCGQTVVKGEVIPAKGHSFGSWYVEVPNRYMENGEEHRDCKDCNHYESRVLEFSFTLGQVQNIRVSSKKTSVKLSYDKVAGANRYEIWVDGEYVTSTSKTSYTVEKLTQGVNYEFMVVARNSKDDNYFYGPGSEPVVARPYYDLDSGYKMSLSDSEVIYDGEAQMPVVTVKKSSSGKHDIAEGVDYEITYENNVNIGTATVTVTGIGRYGGTLTKTFEILPDQVQNLQVEAISEDTLQLTFDPVLGAEEYWIYRSGSRIAKITETTYTANELKAGKTYKFSVKANTVVDGENYTGASSETDSGKPVYRLEGGSVTVKYAERAYTGKSRTNTFTVKNADGKTLKGDTDYVVSYENNKNVGTATATITGKGKYEGTLTAVFDIVPAQMNKPKAKVEQLEYGTAIYVTFKTVPQAEWFAIYLNGELYTKTEEFGHFTEYLKPGVYSVAVCAGVTIGDREYIGEASDPVKVTVRHSMEYCTAELSEYEFVYTGKSHKPAVTVYGYEGEVLTEDVDYTLSYKNNKSTGRAYVEVKGKGNYNGTLKEYFTIDPAQVTGLKVSSTTKNSVKISFKKDSTNSTKYYNVYVDGEYDGRTTGSTYTIKNLQLGTTYNVYVVAEKTVSGVTYQGYESDPITVWPGTDISGYKVILEYTEGIFTGDPLMPAVTVKTSSKSSAKTLVQDVDYELWYHYNADPAMAFGQQKLTVTGIGAYAGVITKTFTVVPPEVTNVQAEATGKKSISVTFDTPLDDYLDDYIENVEYWVYVNGSRKAKVTEGSCEISGLQANKSYKITVRTVVNVDGTNVCSDYTDAVKVKTLK